MTHGGEVWAERTIRWHDGDLVLSSDTPWRVRRPGGEMRVVDGIVYGIDVDGSGSPWAARRTSIPTAARRPTSTSPPCAKTWAAQPFAGSRTA